ncbi:hypothetical protein NA644_12400 [Pseudomonas stutzeri]|jgi:hypothetical protein|uniref:Uncharacterized protein n=1 Tax=Stutzerimonas stutzeri TaxID=316 RepID=A0A2N8SNC4_STUST|nr:hypothetical protein [Stutzerimonas stutzeri]EQM76414.1 hypothetical protein L686_17220 [Stutzerimonas stutzeri MF28]MCQ4250107.1 hypothetical protein [Stutzerimonas stutzeri]PNG03981.1 hypothetical protein CXL00_17510 [Stutzerimonas stutzeri]
MNTEAYDLATFSREHSKYLAAIMRAIQLDAKHNEGRNGADLAALAQYLADDMNGYMDSEAERIRREGGK